MERFDATTTEHLETYTPQVAVDGSPMLRPNSTDETKPEVGENQVALFTSTGSTGNLHTGSWAVLPDYRGQLMYHKVTREAVTITDAGEIPSTHTLDEPTQPYHVRNEDDTAWVEDAALKLAHERAAKLSELSELRATNQALAVVVNGVPMQTDRDSRQEMNHYVTESIVNGLINVHWKKADDTFHVFTVQEFKAVYKGIVKYIADCFAHEKTLVDTVTASPTPATEDISTGWPSTTITSS